MFFFKLRIIFLLSFLAVSVLFSDTTPTKRFAYIVSDINIPFWEIMSKGIKDKAIEYGHSVEIYSSNNLKKLEIENTFTSIKNNFDGIILSPISSSSAVFLLKLINKANIPVVISDIGTQGGEYLSYISSDNEDGAYKLGKILTKKMIELNLKDASVGIIAIPQQRENGRLRTKGFLKALNEAEIKSAGLEQQIDFSYEETYTFTKKLIEENSKMKAIWLQGSNRYQGALDAISSMKKSGEILLICFDSEPEFLEMIPKDKIVGSAMQQPYLMGQKAVEQLEKYFNNQNIEKNIKLEILAISKENIESNLKLIKNNVLGIKE